MAFNQVTMKCIFYTLILLVLPLIGIAQQTAVKSNVLIWTTSTPNLALEFTLSDKTTMEIGWQFNPWDFGKNGTKLKHWLLQPEYRIWPCRNFERWFWGIHGVYGQYNVGLPLFVEQESAFRYKGYLYGGGISAGYHWALGQRWNLEMTLGIGYARLVYNKYECQSCGSFLGKYSKNYFGPTKAGVSIVYFLK